MSGNPIGSKPPSPRENQSPTGSAAQGQRAGQQPTAFTFDQASANAFMKKFSLREVIGKWWDRANRAPNNLLAKLKSYSTNVRRGEAATETLKDGGTRRLSPTEARTKVLLRGQKFLAGVEKSLEESVGREDPRFEPLLHKIQNAVSTLKDYAWGSADLSDVDASIRGFTNLKLFLEEGDELHSWGSSTVKVKRTIANIPKIVLMNASEDVTFEDYGKADHLRVESGKRRLLSFHIGFSATRTVFGKGKDSRAYRSNLRAITASALLLGGFDKAVAVKELLTKINSLPNLKDGKSKEDMVKSALDRLATHGDLNALISDLSFELERHSIQAAYNARYNDSYASSLDENFYSDVRDQLLKLENVPNRTIVLQNVAKNILKKEEGYTSGEEQYPDKVMRDLLAATAMNPMAYLLQSESGDADPALVAIKCWTDLMTQEGTGARNDIEREMVRIDQESDPRDIYSDAAQSFADIDKRNMSAEDQAVLLVQCLKHPHAQGSVLLAELNSIKARSQENAPAPAGGDEALLSQQPSHADKYSESRVGDNDGDDDIKYDIGADIIDVTKIENSENETIQNAKENSDNDNSTEESKKDIDQKELMKDSQDNNENDVGSGGDDQRSVMGNTESQNVNTDTLPKTDDADDSDPDGGDELKVSEITDAERLDTPGGPDNTNREN